MMSTAFVRAVLMEYPTAQVDLVVKKGFESLPIPHRGEILPFDKNLQSAYAFGKTLRNKGYSTMFVLPPSFSSALMAFRAGIPRRIGYKGSLRSLLLNRSKSYPAKHRSQHLVTEYLHLMDRVPDSSTIAPGLDFDEEWMARQLSDLNSELPARFVALAPGVMYGPAKQWPVDHFADLVDQLLKADIPVVIIGTQSDGDIGDRLKKQRPGVYNLCGQTNLNQLIAVLYRSELLVSNDSGTMHVMAALQKPQIALFGSTSTVWTGPINKHAKVLQLEMDCSPCFARECRFGHYRCLTDISPKSVFEAVTGMVAGK